MGKLKPKSIAGMVRAWSLPMTVSLVLLGGACALFVGLGLNLYALALAVIAALLLHSGANILNDVNDVSNGVDRPYSATAMYRSHPVLNGEITKGLALRLSLIVIGSGLLLGAYVSYITGPAVFILEIAGALLIASYNGPIANFKAIGLGEIEVSLVWGPLLVLGGFAASTNGKISSVPLLISILPFMIMMSIIYANNYRDVRSDSEAGVRSLAYRTQRHAALIYSFCLFAPYGLGSMLVIFRVLPVTTLITLLTMPYAVKLYFMFKGGSPDIDSKMGTLFTVFNFLLMAGLVFSLM